MTYFFRVVSFNVSWTFMDSKLPLISPEPLCTETSFSIRSLSLQAHPVNNLIGTFIFIVGIVLIISFWPLTKMQNKIYSLQQIVSLMQLPIGFLSMVYVKHKTWTGCNGWLQWLDFSIWIGVTCLFCLMMPLFQLRKKDNNSKSKFAKFALRSLLIGVLVWVTYPLY